MVEKVGACRECSVAQELKYILFAPVKGVIRTVVYGHLLKTMFVIFLLSQFWGWLTGRCLLAYSGHQFIP